MGKPPVNVLSEANINHLRRLLGYVRCEIGQSPDEFVGTVQSILPSIGEPSPEAKRRLVQHYEKSRRVPKYVRDAIKALESVVREG